MLDYIAYRFCGLRNVSVDILFACQEKERKRERERERERERKRVHFINLSSRLKINNLIQIKEIS